MARAAGILPIMQPWILEACAYIARHGNPSLADVARHVGGSPFHLQRMFRLALGITPKQYARRLRFDRFRAAARDGVTAALYTAGFGSSSRLYERASAHLGMTPATYAKGAPGMGIAYDVMQSPVGRLLIAATTRGICAVSFGPVSDLRRQFPKARIRRDPRLLRFARARIRALFDGARDAHLPLDIRGTAFQARVWESLRAIPWGQTRSYAEVARAIGRPRAVRAVAQACGANPVAILVPCHRVIGSDGSLTGYGGGLPRKRRLLEMEAPSAPVVTPSARRAGSPTR